MKGYIYTMFAGADPGAGWRMTDPIFGKTPTLGACVPHIRRVVTPGDMIFTISGRVDGARQYVVGGFEVAEKIDALAALARFPEHKQRRLDDGALAGNIIVNSDGSRSSVDYHTNFEKRLDNYVIGRKPIVLQKSAEIAQARNETLDILGEVFGKRADRVYDITARWRKVDDVQIEKLVSWLKGIKLAHASKR
ncbi:hypothetical protein WMF20_31910 [Sorangium sp. So ce834]|uniref:hypothetical protein n=1 Tax=Sorangium sp. So ce834 TaxID=3133321 RepID=UPI003F5D9CEC